MAQTVINIHAAKTRLSQLIARAEKGERIVISRAGKPVAQLTGMPRSKRSSLEDPLVQVDDFAYDGPVGKMTNSRIDRVIYGG